MPSNLPTHDPTNPFPEDLKLAAIISSLLVLPFAILEALHTTVTTNNAPGLLVLFGFLWLLPAAFLVILLPLVRAVRAGTRVTTDLGSIVFRVGLLTLIGTMWGGILLDQLPCFLGYPNCD